MKIKAAINTHHTGKMPAEWETLSEAVRLAWWREFNGRFHNIELTPDELLTQIRRGHAYTTQHRNYRKRSNFICGQHIALDFDTEDERSTLAALAGDEFVAAHGAFLHTTPSHKPDKPRARAVFILDRPIYDAGKYAELAAALVWKFGAADPVCTDPARFFFGAVDCDVLTLGNVLTLKNGAETLVFPYRDYLAMQKAAASQAAENRQLVDAGNVPAAILEHHSAALLGRVEAAPDGQKYYTLRDIAVTFGGYVAGDYYNLGEAAAWLQNAIRRNPGNVKNLRAADKTIADSLAYGMKRPLFFELRDNTVTAMDPETPQRLPGPLPDDSWRANALHAYLHQLEELLEKLEPADPAWLQAAEEYRYFAEAML